MSPFLESAGRAVNNFTRDVMESPVERRERENVNAALTVLKVAAVALAVVVVVAVVFSVLSASILGVGLGLALGGLALVALYDVYRVADNAQKTNGNIFSKTIAGTCNSYKYESLLDKTILAKPIYNLFHSKS